MFSLGKSIINCSGISGATLFVLPALALTMAQPASAATFDFQFFEAPDSAFTFGTGINDAGLVVGQYVDSSSATRGYVREPEGTLTLFDFPDAITTSVEGINNTDQIVGWTLFEESDLARGLTAQADGTLPTLIDAPGAISQPPQVPATGTLILENNDAGQLVGVVDNADGRQGFLFNQGDFSLINFPGAAATFAVDINNQNEIVGLFVDDQGLFNAYHLKDGIFAEIIPPGSTAAIASGINDRGQIVGFYDNAEGIRQGYLYNGETFQTLSLENALGTVAYKINNQGEITGWRINPGFTSTTGFVAKPVPEPSGLLGLLSLGLVFATKRLLQSPLNH